MSLPTDRGFSIDSVVVGLDPTSPVVRSLKVSARAGYDIVPVPVYYPEVTHILDRPVYRTVREVPGPVDMVNVFRRPRDIPPHVDDILAAHPRVVWLQLGIRNEPAAEAFARAGIQVVQDRCLLVEHRRLR